MACLYRCLIRNIGKFLYKKDRAVDFNGGSRLFLGGSSSGMLRFEEAW